MRHLDESFKSSKWNFNSSYRREIQAIQESLQEKNEQLKNLQSQLQQKDQIADSEKWFSNLERKQHEEKQELSDLRGRLGEVETSLGGQVKEMKEMVQKLEQGCSKTAEEMRGRIGQVESSVEESECQMKQVNEKVQKLEQQTFIPPLNFTMMDFEQHKKDDDDWFSPPFYSHTGGYKMCLRGCANGRIIGKGTHVSLYVHLMRGEHDDYLEWPFHGDVTVQLLNQRSEEEHCEEDTVIFDDSVERKYKGRVTGCDRALSGWGYNKFMAHRTLGYNFAKNTEYLKNDCLKFRVTNIKVRSF